MAREDVVYKRRAMLVNVTCSFWGGLLRFSGLLLYCPATKLETTKQKKWHVVLVVCFVLLQLTGSTFSAVTGLYPTGNIDRVSDLLLNFHSYLFPLICGIYICLMWHANKKLVHVFDFFNKALPHYYSLTDLNGVLFLSGLLLFSHPVQNMVVNFYGAYHDYATRQATLLRNYPDLHSLSSFIGPLVIASDILYFSLAAGKQIAQCFVAVMPLVFGILLQRINQNFKKFIGIDTYQKSYLERILKDHEETCVITCLYDTGLSWLNLIACLERLSRFLYFINQCCKLYASGEPIPKFSVLTLATALFAITVQTIALIFVTEKEVEIRDSLAQALAAEFLTKEDAEHIQKHLGRINARKPGITLAKLMVNREFAAAMACGILSYTLLFAELNGEAKQSGNGSVLNDCLQQLDFCTHQNKSTERRSS